MDIQIRPAKSDDALGIALVSAYTWKTAYEGLMPSELIDARIADVPGIARRMRHEIEQGRGFLIALSEGCVIGFSRFGTARLAGYREHGEIFALYVLSPFQGAGIGGELLMRSAETLRRQGFRQMVVCCLEHNPALGFYLSRGGRIVGATSSEHSGITLHEDIVMFQCDELTGPPR